MYHLVRATGQKCWFQVGAERTRRVRRVAAVAPREASRAAMAQMAEPRLRSISADRSKQIEEILRALQSVSAAQARQLEPDDMGGNAANTAHDEVPERAPDPAQTTTFDSRWIPPAEFSPSIGEPIDQEETRALVPDDRKNPVPDMTKSLKDQARLADTVRVSGLLIATIASIAIATGLYASINGSTVSIGRTRDRGLPVRPGEDMRDQQLPAARDGTMADILERLNREDDLVLSRQPETESDRPAIPATAPDVGEAGRRGD